MHQFPHHFEVHDCQVPGRESQVKKRQTKSIPNTIGIRRAERGWARWYGQTAGDVVEHPVGVVEEHVDDLGDEALVLWRLQLLVICVQNSLDPSGQVSEDGIPAQKDRTTRPL